MHALLDTTDKATASNRGKQRVLERRGPDREALFCTCDLGNGKSIKRFHGVFNLFNSDVFILNYSNLRAS